MQEDRWQKIEKIFNEALVLPSAERAAFIMQKSGNDPALYEEISALITETETNSSFLSDPAFSLGARLIDTEPDALLTKSDFASYKLQKLLGYGGMGTVYLAEDTRLERPVALKVLSSIIAGNKDMISRFQQEARAASSISHPNIAHIYEVGFFEGHYFLAMEYIEGISLRQLMKEGTISPRQSVEIALQISNALVAAHSSGVIHRDIKPDNIILREGKYVRVLDFGLAKFTEVSAAKKRQTHTSDFSIDTTPGMIMGTIAYMSPEQVRGERVDSRTDIWSLGIILYEMLMGARPFQGDSKIETLNAILKENLNGIEKLEAEFSPMLVQIVCHCLTKKVDERFQSARDLAFALETFNKISQHPAKSNVTVAPENTEVKKRPFKRIIFIGLSAVIIILLMGIGWYTHSSSEGTDNNKTSKVNSASEISNKIPTYKQLTFQRGTIWSARFTTDGKSIIYSAAWNGSPPDLFTMRPPSLESKPINLPGANLLSISSKGEMAVLLPKQYLYQFVQRGTLARLPIEGSMPREIAEDVQEADWSPNGENLAIVRWVNGRNLIEYPIGKVLYETTGYISSPRVSPTGNAVAFLEHSKQWDNRGFVSIVYTNGDKEILSGEWSGEEGLAWSPTGNEICFAASKAGESYALYAVSLQKEERILARVPINLTLYDISSEGKVLLSRSTQSTDVYGKNSTESSERNLSWLQIIGLSALSQDGSRFLFTHFGEGSGTNYKVYVRSTKGSPAMQLGDGRALALSPDGKYAIAKLNSPEQLLLLPTAAGDQRLMPKGIIEHYDKASWFPDNQHILFTGNESGHGKRAYIQDILSGEPRVLTTEGVTGTLISPDGKILVASTSENERMLYFIDTGEVRALDSINKDEEIISWSADGKSLYIFQNLKVPIKIYKLNLESKNRQLIKEITPADSSGVFGPIYFFFTSDAESYVYGLRRYLFDLYVVEDLDLR